MVVVVCGGCGDVQWLRLFPVVSDGRGVLRWLWMLWYYNGCCAVVVWYDYSFPVLVCDNHGIA